jgi:hypothetical protein
MLVHADFGEKITIIRASGWIRGRGEVWNNRFSLADFVSAGVKAAARRTRSFQASGSLLDNAKFMASSPGAMKSGHGVVSAKATSMQSASECGLSARDGQLLAC